MYVVWGKAYGNRFGPVIFVSLHVGVDFGVFCMVHVFQLYSQPVWMVSTNKRNPPPSPPQKKKKGYQRPQLMGNLLVFSKCRCIMDLSLLFKPKLDHKANLKFKPKPSYRGVLQEPFLVFFLSSQISFYFFV